MQWNNLFARPISLVARPMQFADAIGDIEVPVSDILEQVRQLQATLHFEKAAFETLRVIAASWSRALTI